MGEGEGLVEVDAAAGVPFSMRQTAVWFILMPALVTRSASSVVLHPLT